MVPKPSILLNSMWAFVCGGTKERQTPLLHPVSPA